MSRTRPASKAAEMTKIALLVAMNCVSAYIIIPLPFALSPIAMQPFIVNLVGFSMTPKQAFMTMLVYILVGLAGIPVFTFPEYRHIPPSPQAAMPHDAKSHPALPAL